MNIREVASKYEAYQIEMRRYFHQYPEISGEEYETSKRVKAELDKMGISWRDCGMETGVLAEIKGGKPGKTILLRADMDALSIDEETGAEYSSKNPGVMHACGHDCHISMLLTAAKILNDIKDELPGTVKLAFQPAEEVGQGAAAMIEEGAMDGVDGCFSMHVWADLPAGTLACEAGPQMGAASKFTADIIGVGGHGSAPHQTVDATLVTAAVVLNLQSIASRNVSPMDPVVVTVGQMEAGSRWNIIAGKGRIEGTTRCFSDEIYDKLPEWVERVVSETAQAYGAEGKVEYTKILPPVINDKKMAELVRGAAVKILGTEGAVYSPPTLVGEDFTFFARKAPGAMAFLGIANDKCGAVHPQHSAMYCVDETALIKGAMMYVQVALEHNGTCEF